MRNIAFFVATGPRAGSNFATRRMTSATSALNSSRRMSYAGLLCTNHGRLLFCSSPARNWMSAGTFTGSRCKEISSADVRHLHLVELRGFAGADFRVAILAFAPHVGDRSFDLRIACATAQQRAQIMSARGEQAGVERTFGAHSEAGGNGGGEPRE